MRPLALELPWFRHRQKQGDSFAPTTARIAGAKQVDTGYPGNKGRRATFSRNSSDVEEVRPGNVAYETYPVFREASVPTSVNRNEGLTNTGEITATAPLGPAVQTEKIIDASPRDNVAGFGNKKKEKIPPAAVPGYPRVNRNALSLPPVVERAVKAKHEIAARAVAAPPSTGNLAEQISLRRLVKKPTIVREKEIASGADRSYPALSSNALSLPPVVERAVKAKHKLVARTADSPSSTGNLAEQISLHRLLKPTINNGKEEPVSRKEQNYSRVAKAPFPSPFIVEKPSRVTGESTYRTGEYPSSYIGRDKTVTPLAPKSDEVKEPEPDHIAGGHAGLTKINRQMEHVYLHQLTSRPIAPIVRSIDLKRKSGEGSRHTIGNRLPGISHPKANGRKDDSSHIGVNRKAILPPLVNMSGSGLKRPRQSVITGEARNVDSMTSGLLPGMKMMARESAEAIPYKLPLWQLPGVKLVEEEGTATHRQMRPVRRITGINKMRERPTGKTGDSYAPHATIAGQGNTGRDMAYRYPGESPLTDGTDNRASPFTKSLSPAINIPVLQFFKPGDKASGGNAHSTKPPGHKYVTASLNREYVGKPAMELPVVSPISLKTDVTNDRNEELFRYASDTIPGMTYENSSNAPKLALAPVNRTTETQSQTQTSTAEVSGPGGEEKEVVPDIRAIARQVYPLIKRMVMIEKERLPA